MDTGTLAAKPDSVIKPQKLSHEIGRASCRERV